MRFAPDGRADSFIGWRRSLLLLAGVSVSLLWVSLAGRAPALRAQAQSNPYTTWSVTIVLPPMLMAGHPATLAVLGVDGKLAPGVTVILGDGQTLTTDRTGRAVFTVPATGDYLLARGSGASTAALIDPAAGSSEPAQTTLLPIVSMRDRFWVCSAGLRGDADEDSVNINDQPALVLAASPECLVALPGVKSTPGPATILLESPGTRATASTTLVALDFDAPQPGLVPGKKSRLDVRVRGSEQKVRLAVENETPGVLRFIRGDAQEVQTTGGLQNVATLEVRAIRTGDYSFRGRLLPAADVAVADRYLQLALARAPQESRSDLKGILRRLARHPGETQLVRAELNEILTETMAGDFRTLLEAAREAL
jgi:hypothetical protein